MCIEVIARCEFCSCLQHRYWENCNTYWNKYRKSIVEDAAHRRPKPVECSRRVARQVPMGLGSCPELEQCASAFALDEQRHQRACEGKTLPLESEDVVEITFSKRHVVSRGQPEGFVESAKEDAEPGEQWKESIREITLRLRDGEIELASEATYAAAPTSKDIDKEPKLLTASGRPRELKTHMRNPPQPNPCGGISKRDKAHWEIQRGLWFTLTADCPPRRLVYKGEDMVIPEPPRTVHLQ